MPAITTARPQVYIQVDVPLTCQIGHTTEWTVSNEEKDEVLEQFAGLFDIGQRVPPVGKEETIQVQITDTLTSFVTEASFILKSVNQEQR